MGLDMYLQGKKFFWTDWENPEKTKKEEGFRLSEKWLELGYWRKHPNLQGYIINNFAKGEDNCDKVYLSEDNIKQIIAAIKEKDPPETNGFFFGKSASNKKQREGDTAIFEAALKWHKKKIKNVSKTIYYKASW